MSGLKRSRGRSPVPMEELAREGGFALIEVMVSIVILCIAVIGMYGTIVAANGHIVDAKRVTQATNFARKKLEKVMDTNFRDITQVYPAGRIYDANPFDSNYRLSDPDGDYAGEYGDSLPNGEWQVQYSGTDPLTIQLTVSWKLTGAAEQQRSVTLSSRVAAGKM
jgi:prepilin-type N-terminal cleavage/methylation domain-containing protein